MGGSIRLGKVFGIRILMHFTFLFLFVWVAYLDLREGYTWQRILFDFIFVLAVFACVIMHEFGHALTARRYGIETKQILLLPIGGVAQLERMPEKPGQELVVALMGPAVNIAIIIVLLPVVIALYGTDALMLTAENLSRIESNILIRIIWANAFLFVFNLIPAFPMDGGRVLRALLGFKLGFLRSTQIATRVGQGLAVLFALFGLWNGSNFLLVLIAIFVFVGAQYEYKMVAQKTAMKGYKIKEAMLSRFTTLSPENSLLQAVKELLAGSDIDFLVMNDGRVTGILTKERLLKAINEHSSELERFAVGQVMMTEFPQLQSEMPIESAAEIFAQMGTSILPVYQGTEFIGAISAENINEMLEVGPLLGRKRA